jgi:predicted transcriptional regulator
LTYKHLPSILRHRKPLANDAEEFKDRQGVDAKLSLGINEKSEGNVTVKEIVNILEAEVLSGEDKLATEVKYGGSADMMSDILALSRRGQLVLTGYTYPQVVRTAVVSELLGLVVVRGREIPPETVELARQNNFLLLRTKAYMYSSCGKLYQAGLRGVDERNL